MHQSKRNSFFTSGYGSKKGTQKTLLVKGQIDQNLRSLGVFFSIHSQLEHPVALTPLPGSNAENVPPVAGIASVGIAPGTGPPGSVPIRLGNAERNDLKRRVGDICQNIVFLIGKIYS